MGWAAVMVGVPSVYASLFSKGLGIFGGAIADRFGLNR